MGNYVQFIAVVEVSRNLAAAYLQMTGEESQKAIS